MLSKSLSKTCSTRLSILERCEPPYFAVGSHFKSDCQTGAHKPFTRGEDTQKDKHFGLDRINIGLLNTVYRCDYCLVLNIMIAATKAFNRVITQCSPTFFIGD